MKKRITLSVDEELIERAKYYSEKRGKTLSKAVEDYFHLLGVKMRDEREKKEEGGRLASRPRSYNMRQPQVKPTKKPVKKRITLSVDEELIERAKYYSEKRGKTLSKSVEGYFHFLGVKMRDEREKEEKGT